MDELVKLFLKCGVKSVELLERSKLPIETQGTTAAQNNQGMQGQMTAAILEKRQISVNLTLEQGPLQRLVSSLSSTEMPYFTSLRVLRIENQRLDGPLRSEIKVLVAAPVAATAAPEEAASDEIKPPPPAVPDAVAVFGNELLRVRMEIDLVKFLDAAAGIAAQTPPAGR